MAFIMAASLHSTVEDVGGERSEGKWVGRKALTLMLRHQAALSLLLLTMLSHYIEVRVRGVGEM